MTFFICETIMYSYENIVNQAVAKVFYEYIITHKIAKCNTNVKGGVTLPQFYTIEEVADILKVSKRAVSSWIKEGRLKGNRLTDSKIVRISDESLSEFIQATEIRKES